MLETSDVAHRTGIAANRVEAIEAGANDVTFLEVVALAELFGSTADEIWVATVGQPESTLAKGQPAKQGRDR
jgi:plasmid maintenance system antidote protein VapI